VEHPWQEYLKANGPSHLRRASRGLRLLTGQIRKIDETANIKGTLPRQLGFIVGLQEIYARRVGLIGRLPHELGELDQLRVLSMGNNQLCGELPASLGKLKHLQRIVLHQNKLTGQVRTYV
jgi:Leucine-rich repeat (LRR) protein